MRKDRLPRVAWSVWQADHVLSFRFEVSISGYASHRLNLTTLRLIYDDASERPKEASTILLPFQRNNDLASLLDAGHQFLLPNLRSACQFHNDSTLFRWLIGSAQQYAAGAGFSILCCDIRNPLQGPPQCGHPIFGFSRHFRKSYRETSSTSRQSIT